MQYMLVLDEDSDLIATDEQHQEAARPCGRPTRRGGSVLAMASSGRSTGPFAEAKEVIVGYVVIEASDVEAATAVAARCPNAEFGSVEVREIVPMG